MAERRISMQIESAANDWIWSRLIKSRIIAQVLEFISIFSLFKLTRDFYTDQSEYILKELNQLKVFSSIEVFDWAKSIEIKINRNEEWANK